MFCPVNCLRVFFHSTQTSQYIWVSFSDPHTARDFILLKGSSSSPPLPRLWGFLSFSLIKMILVQLLLFRCVNTGELSFTQWRVLTHVELTTRVQNSYAFLHKCNFKLHKMIHVIVFQGFNIFSAVLHQINKTHFPELHFRQVTFVTQTQHSTVVVFIWRQILFF